MGIIERSLNIIGKKKKRVIVFFDSGSSFSIIKKDLVQEIGILKQKRVSIKVKLGDGSLMKFDKAILLEIIMNKNSYFHWFLVGDIPEQVIIGADFLQEFGHTLEFKKDKVISKNLHLKNRRGKYVL